MYEENTKGRKRCCHIILGPLLFFILRCRFSSKSNSFFSLTFTLFLAINSPTFYPSIVGQKSVHVDVRKNIITLPEIGMSQHEISRRLKVSRQCIRRTIRKFDQYHTVATKPGAGRPSKVTDRQKRAIKLEQLRDDTLSLNDLVRYTHTNLNLSINRVTVSRILGSFDMISYIAPRKPRITAVQRRKRLEWCYEHLSWTLEDWSNVIFSAESNFELLNRKNRIYIRRFRNDRTRFERSQERVHKGGGIIYLLHGHMY